MVARLFFANTDARKRTQVDTIEGATVPVFILETQAQVLELSHEVLQLLTKSSSDGCARSLTGGARLTSL